MHWRILFAAWAVLVGFGVWRARFYHPSVDGGPVLVYEVDVDHPYERGFLPSEIEEQAEKAIRARVARMAPVSEVHAAGKRVEVKLPPGYDLTQLKRALPVPARLEFKLVDDGSDFMKKLHAGEMGHDGWSERYSGATHQDVYVRAPTREALVQAFASVDLPDDHQIAFEQMRSYEDDTPGWRSYYLFRKAEISNADISDVDVNWDPQTGRPEVSLTFTREGADRFAEVTGRWVGRKMAIMLDGNIQSAPVIETRITGGRARITMGGMGDPMQLREEAKDLVACLRSGALPAPIKLAEER